MEEVAAANSEPTDQEPHTLERQTSWALPEIAPSPCSLVAWGRADLGQTGIGSEAACSGPVAVDALQSKDIVYAAGSVYNSAYVTRDGEAYTTGANNEKQLGVKGIDTALSPVRVSGLDAHTVHCIACGESHMLAVVDNGSLAAWGSNEYGQLGIGEQGGSAGNPRILKALKGVHFARVACGTNHSLALTSGGQVYSFGEGSFGALGEDFRGSPGGSSPSGLPDTANRSSPAAVLKLFPEAIISIAAGQGFSAAVSLSGRVYTWGRGKYGALGSGRVEDRSSPCAVPGIADAIQVACGAHHCVVATASGAVYSWGLNADNQLGHGKMADNGSFLSHPRHIDALAGQHITQVSAGAAHSLFVGQHGQLWGCGSNTEMQLAQEQSVSSAAVPQRILHAAGRPVRFAVAAGAHSLAVLEQQPQTNGELRRSLGTERRQCLGCFNPLPLPPDLIQLAESASKFGASHKQRMMLTQAIEDVCSSPAALISVMAGPEDPEGPGSPNRSSPTPNHGFSIERVNHTYKAILQVYSPELLRAFGQALINLLKNLAMYLRAMEALSAQHDTSEWLPRLIFLLLQNPLNGSRDQAHIILQPLAGALKVLCSKPEQERVLSRWLGQLSADQFASRCVRPIMRHVDSVAPQLDTGERRSSIVAPAIWLAEFLSEVNEHFAVKQLARSEFYSAAFSESIDVVWEYHAWRQVVAQGYRKRRFQELLLFCMVPWILTPACKANFFKVEAMMQMQRQVHASGINAWLHGMNPQAVQFLVVRIRRGHVLEDALNQIAARADELKKPLRIIFSSGDVDEEGLDQGGVKKEFFQLLTREIFNEAYGMFTFNEETRTYWFSKALTEAGTEFRLVGQLMGLAIFNSVILDAHFPHCLYLKLLGKKPGFADLKRAMPELGRGLQQLLDFDGDVESTFAQSFEVQYDYFGELRTVELKPGGSDIPVTNDNRAEYVRLMTDYHLNKSVEEQFSAFASGFLEVCDGPVLREMLRDDELELLVCGLPHLDFEALQAAAKYEGGFSAEHPTVRSFWQVLRELPLDKKKRFLSFATGSDRAPVGGLGQLSLVIQRAGGDTDRLPSAHTCFNYLLLPEYASQEKLKQRLLLAIENAQGFGLQ